MSTATTPLNAAHQHATNADEFIAKGLLIPAAEEHQKSADAFQSCIEASNDENTKRTLRMLYNEHSKAAKELQRRIAALREEGVDPTLPQKPAPPRPSPASPPPTHGSSASPLPHPKGRIPDSQVDESFMLLGQQSTDASDAFNTFWKAMEHLDHVSQPLAFVTTSLGLTESPQRDLGRNGSYSSDTDTEGSARSRRAFLGSRSKAQSPDGSSPTILDDARLADATKSSHLRQSVIDLRNEFDEIAEEDYDSSDSFCFIPSKSEPSPSALKEENNTLRSDLEAMQKRLESAERMLKLRQEHDQQLRENIAVARREAQRAMGASLHSAQRTGQSTFDLSSLNLVPPPPPVVPIPISTNRDKEAQLSRRVKELEEELRTMRVENEKQKAMIAKFRERWDKLKDSARRKREAKAAAEAHHAPVHERIDEEPEAEAE
jgi:DNA repair exonuclease SbcCD ATPase subunit